MSAHLATNAEPAPIRAGRDATVTRSPLGFSVSLGRPKLWEHPWQTRLHWLGDLKQWVATVRPGFVNGAAPIVRTTAKEAIALAKNGSFYNGLITATSSAGDIARAAALAREGEQDLQDLGAGDLDIALYNNPPLKLGFIKVGFDSGGGVGTAVPSFFRDLGVQEAPKIDPLEDPFALASALFAGPKPGNRLLRRCDLVLHQPRLALTSTITLEPGIVTGISNVTQTLSLRPPLPGDRLRVIAVPFWSVNFAETAGINPLDNDFEEPTYDEKLISTVFLLSAPDAPVGSEPDQTWVPYVRHSLFWNLHYHPKTDLDVPQFDDVVGKLASIASFIGAGSGSIAVNFLSASINDATQAAANILNAHTMAGSWWTATGGGSTSEFPPEPEPKGKPAGFDKAARLQAKRIAAARKLKHARLDPPFPFRALPIDFALLDS